MIVPPSKSHTMRALIFAAKASSKSIIHNYLNSPDTDAMIQALRQLGIQIEKNEALVVHPAPFKKELQTIDAGNSGQVYRFISALTDCKMHGDCSIQKRRVIQPLQSALQQLKRQAGEAHLCGEDSQPVSALLMAAAFWEGTTTLHVSNPKETPWIDLTLFWLKKMGACVRHDNYQTYWIEGPLHYEGFETSIPADFSSAAFPLAKALITQQELQFMNLDFNDIQGDKALFAVLKEMGAEIDGACVKPSKLRGLAIDMDQMIDALPILALIGCFARGKTTLYNAKIARKKESDRLMAITQELRKMGAHIEERDDSLQIYPSKLKKAHLNAHNDHRIALTLQVAMQVTGKCPLAGAECIYKSYPHEYHSLWF